MISFAYEATDLIVRAVGYHGITALSSPSNPVHHAASGCR